MSKAPNVILNCQQTHFSIAKYYGGVKAFDTTYTYFPDEDALVRDDLIDNLMNNLKKMDFDEAIKKL